MFTNFMCNTPVCTQYCAFEGLSITRPRGLFRAPASNRPTHSTVSSENGTLSLTPVRIVQNLPGSEAVWVLLRRS